jgi:hypothetical protein
MGNVTPKKTTTTATVLPDRRRHLRALARLRTCAICGSNAGTACDAWLSRA